MSEDINFTHYGAFEITRQGLVLRQRVIAGSEAGESLKVDFTRGAIGQGRPMPGTDTHFLTGLIDHAVYVPIKESYAREANHIMVIVIDGLKIDSDIVMTEIGIFVRLIDAVTGVEIMPEVLYGYTFTQKYDYIPSGKSYNLHREIAFDTILSRDGKFEIVFDNSLVYITRKEFEGFLDDIKEPHWSRKIGYDNSVSNLTAGDVQTAIDEIDRKVDDLSDKFYRQAITGNVLDYIDWANDYPRIRSARIQSLWYGANTVRVLILECDSEFASDTLIDCFQYFLDPNSSGLGNGAAPIGAHVTVESGTAYLLDISADIQLEDGYDQAEGALIAVKHYIEFNASLNGCIDYDELLNALLSVPSINSIWNFLLNGDISSISLGDDDVPVINNLTLEVV